MRATVPLRGQRNGGHTVMSSVMEAAQGQESAGQAGMI